MCELVAAASFRFDRGKTIAAVVEKWGFVLRFIREQDTMRDWRSLCLLS